MTQVLPTHLPVNHSLNPTAFPIRILNPTSGPNSYVKSEYAYIRSYIQSLHASSQETNKLDAVIHLGMADGWEWYTVEERAFQEGMTSTWWGLREEQEGYYMVLDDNGETVRDIKGENEGMWEGMPVGLGARFDVERVAREARSAVNSEDLNKYKTTAKEEEKLRVQIVPHFEAGNYCCGFIFYESLATCVRRRLDTKIAFCHVPGWRDEERLERGAAVVCAVIGAICNQIPKGKWPGIGYPSPPPLPPFPGRLL